MSTPQRETGIPASGSFLPEANLLQKDEIARIWRSLYDQQVKQGPHPDDHKSVKNRLERECRRIGLTVNWTVMKLGGRPVPELSKDDVLQVFTDTAAGKGYSRPRKALRWLQDRLVPVLGWVAACGIGIVAFYRPVVVQATAPPPSVVIEHNRVPSVIHFRQEGNKSFAWEGTGTPDSGDGRWVTTEFMKVP
jgi:hypothetical protein